MCFKVHNLIFIQIHTLTIEVQSDVHRPKDKNEFWSGGIMWRKFTSVPINIIPVSYWRNLSVYRILIPEEKKWNDFSRMQMKMKP